MRTLRFALPTALVLALPVGCAPPTAGSTPRTAISTPRVSLNTQSNPSQTGSKEVSEKCVQLFTDWKRTREKHFLEQTVRICEELANRGSSRGQFILATVILETNVAHKSSPDELLAAASAQKHPIAQYDLARRLLEADASSQPAKRWLMSSACSGYPPAIREIRERAWGEVNCPTQQTGLDGAWGGTLPLQVATDDLKNSALLELVIDGDDVRINGAWGGRPVPLMPDAMKLRRLKRSAVISGLADGWDDDGNWSESYTIALTQVDVDTLDVVFSRQVNNTNLSPKTDNATFVAVWHGTLERRSSPPKQQ